MRKQLLALLGFSLAATVAHADELSADYKTALKQGRALEDKGDYQGAMNVFMPALAAKPNDNGVMASETSVVAFQLKQYGLAAELASQAVVASNSPTLMASAKFNVARSFEAQGLKQKAIDAYADSLTSRYRKSVLERLALLDATKATQVDPFAMHPMQGPLAKLSPFCTKLEAQARRDSGADPKPDPDIDAAQSTDDDDDATVTVEVKNCARLEPQQGEVTQAVARKGRAITEARVVTLETNTETRTGKYFSQTERYVVVKTAKGWWASAVLTASGSDHCQDHDQTVRQLSISGDRLVIRFDSERMHHCGGTSGTQSSSVAIIGVGASGVPQLMRPIEYSVIQNDGASWGNSDTDDKVTDQQVLTFKLTPTGIEFKAKAGKDLLDLVGKHPLIFR